MNPFAALGLPPDPALTDADIRTAWRVIAAATHPDRPDGGDLARYTAASAAYAELRTPWGRRHPFMYASALPIALAIFFLWRPPHAFPPEAIAAYTLFLLIVLRLCVSLYQIPSVAGLAERGTADTTRQILDALNRPGKTLAVVDMSFLLRRSGVLDRLQAQGAIDVGQPCAHAVWIAV